MKESADKTDAQPIQRRQLTTISERKLAANRENAKKSTGPKTPAGKAFSRRNALKHGLFATNITDFEELGEDPKQYEELLDGLWNQYEPIGKVEEILVERIAFCYWRLKRASRYEHAVNLADRRDYLLAELREQAFPADLPLNEDAALVELHRAKKEIEKTGRLSQETKERILRSDPCARATWSNLETALEERIREEWPREEDEMRQKQLEETKLEFAELMVKTSIGFFEFKGRQRRNALINGSRPMPNFDGLDRVQRLETNIQKYLNQTCDQLERLQRTRRGEAVLPPVRLDLS